MTFMHTPVLGVVWDSVYGPQGSEGRILLPTKKPPFCSASFRVLYFVSLVLLSMLRSLLLCFVCLF